MKLITCSTSDADVIISDDATCNSYTWDGEASPSEIAEAYAELYDFDGEASPVRIRMDFYDGETVWGSLRPDGTFAADDKHHF